MSNSNQTPQQSKKHELGRIQDGMPAGNPDGAPRTLSEHHVRTGRPDDERDEMRMPHERDESEDSQASDVREVVKQAYKDVNDGLVDTDLRATGGVDEVVNDRPGTPPEKVVKKGVE